MIIKKIIENASRKYTVKNLPRDAEYKQQSVNDDKIYYSKTKQSYYVVEEKREDIKNYLDQSLDDIYIRRGFTLIK